MSQNRSLIQENGILTPPKQIRRLPGVAAKHLNYLVSPIETLFTRSTPNFFPTPPIFIIGPPRSGSTLLYQILSEYFDVGYLSNLHCLLWGAPSWVERTVRPLRRRKKSDFTSQHGKVTGWMAPSECGNFWYRFFRRFPQYVPLEEADPEKMSEMRRAVHALVSACNRPFLFKNMNCALRLRPICRTLPEALFIVTHRELTRNALSLLKVRKRIYGDYDRWWSIEPPEIAALRALPSYQQVVEQVRSIHVLIDQDRREIGFDRFLDVQYETLCNDVHGTLARLEDFFHDHDLELKRRGEVPTHFLQQNEQSIPEELFQKLVSYASQAK